MYDYFYGAESEQFSFYRIPKVLFTEERFKNISAEAKVLYGLLLDRMSLSAKNGWQDKENRVYIIFTIEDIMEAIPSDLATFGTEAKKLLQELQSRNERMFLLTFLVVNVADNKQRLSNNVFQAMVTSSQPRAKPLSVWAGEPLPRRKSRTNPFPRSPIGSYFPYPPVK